LFVSASELPKAEVTAAKKVIIDLSMFVPVLEWLTPIRRHHAA